LECEQQTLTYRYDAKTDMLGIFQVYKGIFGADRNDGLSKDELEQLDSVLAVRLAAQVNLVENLLGKHH
jgi:hypothetical protein